MAAGQLVNQPVSADRCSPFSAVAEIIHTTSSGSILSVRSSSNVTRARAAPIVASTVRPIAVAEGMVMET